MTNDPPTHCGQPMSRFDQDEEPDVGLCGFHGWTCEVCGADVEDEEPNAD